MKLVIMQFSPFKSNMYTSATKCDNMESKW